MKKIDKIYRTYTHTSAFYWDSKLSKKRKEEIIAWVMGLSEKDAQMLEDLLDDQRKETIDYCDGYSF